MRRTVIIETHGWRGISYARDTLFTRVLVLGWVTIAIAPGSIIQKLRALYDKVKP